MVLSEEQIRENEDYGLTTFNKHGKAYLFGNCEICGEDFVSEIIKCKDGGIRIPRYCEQCIYDENIDNQNYHE